MRKSEARHTCFKDLEEYRKKDDLLEDLTKDEKDTLLTNIGAASKEYVDTLPGITKTPVIYKTYEEVLKLIEQSKLNLAVRYVITDFQTIYESNVREIGKPIETWGGDFNHPSTICQLILTPISNNKFDTRVIMLDDTYDNSYKWEVYYDITKETLQDGQTTKGKITYLRDENNNSAYYDFKHILFRVFKSSFEKASIKVDFDYIDLYTFNSGYLNGIEASEHLKNNQLSFNTYRTIFTEETNNNIILDTCINNLILNTFEYNRIVSLNNSIISIIIKNLEILLDSNIIDNEIINSMNNAFILKIIGNNKVKFLNYIDLKTETEKTEILK